MNKSNFEKRISAGTRVYYIDVHTDKKGQPYIALTEIPTDKRPGGSEKQKRQRIFIHSNNMDKVVNALQEAVNYIKSDNQ